MKQSKGFQGLLPLRDNQTYGADSPGALPALADQEAQERLRGAYRNAWADNTKRAYSTAWRQFADWAGKQGVEALPADPHLVAGYLGARDRDGCGIATLRMDAAAIAAFHRLAGHDNPCTSPPVTLALRGFARAAAGIDPDQARALDAEAVAIIRASLSGKVNSSPVAARDMALVSVMTDAGLRRSEASRLLWRDVEPESDGSGRLTIRHSKTDQEGEGAVVALSPAAMADLDNLAALRTRRAPEGRIFPISGSTITRRIQAIARAAGLGEGYSGHSGRVGLAARMTRNGAPAAAVMRQGRWKSIEMVARYTRKESAAEALRYL